MAEFALGAVQTSQGLLKLADMVDEIRRAKLDIDYFHRETTNFNQVLEAFSTVVGGSIGHLQKDQQGPRRALLDSTIGLFENARRDIEWVVNRTASNINNVDSPLQKITIRIRWYMRRNFITGLRFKLERVKTSANLCILTITYEDIIRQIRELESAQQPVPREITIKLHHYFERVRSEKVIARKAAKKMISFQMSHKGVDSFSHDDTQLFKEVEKNIQRQASRVAPKRRRPHAQNSSSRHEVTSLTGNTTDDPMGVQFTPRRERKRHHAKEGSLRSHPRERERIPKSSRSRYRQRSTSPAPPSTSSRHTRAENHPVAADFSTRMEGNVSDRVVTDCRVRDDGQSVCVERGVWPKRVWSSSQQSLDDNTHAKVNPTTDTKNESRSRLVAPEQQERIQKKSNNIPDAFPSQDGEDKMGTEAKGDHADSNGDKWQPLPPFTHEDLKRRGNT